MGSRANGDKLHVSCVFAAAWQYLSIFIPIDIYSYARFTLLTQCGCLARSSNISSLLEKNRKNTSTFCLSEINSALHTRKSGCDIIAIKLVIRHERLRCCQLDCCCSFFALLRVWNFVGKTTTEKFNVVIMQISPYLSLILLKIHYLSFFYCVLLVFLVLIYFPISSRFFLLVSFSSFFLNKKNLVLKLHL